MSGHYIVSTFDWHEEFVLAFGISLESESFVLAFDVVLSFELPGVRCRRYALACILPVRLSCVLLT